MVAVVVGGGSGIGQSVVEAYRAKGVPTVVWDIAGKHDITCDVSDTDSIDLALSQTLKQAGVPDQLTITAGVSQGGLLLDASVEDWDRVLNVNARGPWLVMRAVARALLAENHSGSFVATSSISAHLVDRATGLYCASKAALSMLIKVAACEWGPSNIRVNGVGPGATRTPMLGDSPIHQGWLAGVAERTALGRIGDAADIAPVVLALHELAWVTGQVIDCDGGLSLHSPIDVYSAVAAARSAV